MGIIYEFPFDLEVELGLSSTNSHSIWRGPQPTATSNGKVEWGITLEVEWETVISWTCPFQNKDNDNNYNDDSYDNCNKNYNKKYNQNHIENYIKSYDNHIKSYKNNLS